jgi:hypothetical protein
MLSLGAANVVPMVAHHRTDGWDLSVLWRRSPSMLLDGSYSAKFQTPRRADNFGNYSAVAGFGLIARLHNGPQAHRIVAG